MLNKKALITVIVLFFLFSIAMFSIDLLIQNELTPLGIISFEFIKSIEASNMALEAWGDQGRIAVGISLGMDFFYVALYVIILYAFLQMAAQKAQEVSVFCEKTLLKMAYFSPLLGLLDYIENYSLIELLLGSQYAFWPVLAYYCALIKFSGLALFITFAIFGYTYSKVKTA